MTSNAEHLLRITTFSLAQMWAQTNEGEVVPITVMLDEFNEETTEKDECETFTCGPLENGKWFAVRVKSFTPMRLV